MHCLSSCSLFGLVKAKYSERAPLVQAVNSVDCRPEYRTGGVRRLLGDGFPRITRITPRCPTSQGLDPAYDLHATYATSHDRTVIGYRQNDTTR